MVVDDEDIEINDGCPDCWYAELFADSEADKHGSYAVSCPNCGWRGIKNEYDYAR
jgi:predicted RNA-binding Zn-ribbon protein involved in translation (DUF1610 family)